MEEKVRSEKKCKKVAVGSGVGWGGVGFCEGNMICWHCQKTREITDRGAPSHTMLARVVVLRVCKSHSGTAFSLLTYPPPTRDMCMHLSFVSSCME